ncbi:hypothetical protein SAMN05421793_10716 [Epilithonimonas hominis]|uniref:Uncharacterized protein n=2 Tax=Epilithonimonas hominis TaxID=420404 RepID=A0A1H6INF9_9FLAO|nr:hypothetical protein SAMN05421793_10716 [Epilithonimonas hominis]
MKSNTNQDISISEAVREITDDKNLSGPRKAELASKFVKKAVQYQISGGNDMVIGYIKYKTYDQPQAKAQAIIEFYGKDFMSNKDVMRKLIINKILTQSVILSLAGQYGMKKDDIENEISKLE